MDVILVQPRLDYTRGGSDRVVLELALKYSAPVYTCGYDAAIAFPEFREVDVRKIPGTALSKLAESMNFLGDANTKKVLSDSVTLSLWKPPRSYDVISSHNMPSELVRCRNERVNWFCHGHNAVFGYQEDMDKGRSLFALRYIKTGIALYRMLDLSVLKKMETICACSGHTKSKVERFTGRSDIKVIYPGVDFENFYCEDYEPYFAFISRISPEKNMEYAIDAFRLFSKKAGKKWKMVIAGVVGGDPRAERYLSKLRESARGLNVSFVTNPNTQTVRKIYANCTATIFTPLDEAFGLVVLEGMASEKPCIAINKGGPTESIVDSETGFLVESPSEMAERMSELAGNPSLVECMGRKGRAQVKQNFTWRHFHTKMHSALKKTAAK